MKPVELPIPETFTTERLLMRIPAAGDGADVTAAIRESFAELRQWMTWATDIPGVEEIEARGLENRAQFFERSLFSYNLYLQSSGEFVGKASLFDIDWSVPKLEIGYWMSTKFVGQGLMSEAVAALIALSFDEWGVRRIEIRCDPRNLRSAAIPERLGFVREGILRNEQRSPQGDLRDTAVYASVR